MRLLLLMTWLLAAAAAFGKVPIQGEPEADVERMYQYVASRNPAFPRELAQAFHDIGRRYGIRGDVALCQAIIETGWFRFNNGTGVPADAHNYCGLGVKSRGEKGCRFESMQQGVTAMIQHLFAYCSTGPLPEGERVVDPRFTFVRRGCAPTWESLSGRWAMSGDYGRKILNIHAAMMRHPVVAPEPPAITVCPEETELLAPDSIELEILNELQNEAIRYNPKY